MESTREHLDTLQKDYQYKILELVKKKEELGLEYDEITLKLGDSKNLPSVRMIEELNSHYEDKRKSTEQTKLKYDRVSSIISSVGPGVKNLFEKLENVPGV